MTGQPADTRVTWRWDDGWVAVRAETAEAERRMMWEAVDRFGSANSNWEVHPVLLFVFDPSGLPRPPILIGELAGTSSEYRAKIFGTSCRIDAVLHFVSMVSEVRLLAPGLKIARGFAHAARMSAKRQAALGRPDGPSSVILAHPALTRQSLPQVLAPWLCPGHCPDPDCEVDVLLGNLPRLLFSPTEQL